jgi:hypothetical protein
MKTNPRNADAPQKGRVPRAPGIAPQRGAESRPVLHQWEFLVDAHKAFLVSAASRTASSGVIK